MRLTVRKKVVLESTGKCLAAVALKMDPVHSNRFYIRGRIHLDSDLKINTGVWRWRVPASESFAMLPMLLHFYTNICKLVVTVASTTGELCPLLYGWGGDGFRSPPQSLA